MLNVAEVLQKADKIRITVLTLTTTCCVYTFSVHKATGRPVDADEQSRSAHRWVKATASLLHDIVSISHPITSWF